MFDWSLVKSAAKNAAAEIRKKRQRLEELRIRKEDINAAPLCKSDIVDLVEKFIDEEASKYPEALGKQLALNYKSSSPHLVERDGSIVSLLGMLRDAAGINSGQTIQKNLFFFFREQFKAGFRQAVDAMPAIQAAGLPLVKRVAEIKKIDAEMAELEEELATIAAGAREAGLTI